MDLLTVQDENEVNDVFFFGSCFCRVGAMTVNQASNIYNLPYGSIYGRIKRIKNEGSLGASDQGHNSMVAANPVNMVNNYYYAPQ